MSIPGTYTLLVGDNGGTDAANCGVYLQRLNSPDNATTISYDQTVTGTIALLAEMHTYTFTGSSGDLALVAMSDKSSYFDPEVRLYAPGGSLLTSNWSSGNYVEVTQVLPNSTSYALLIGDNGGTDSSDYALALSRQDGDEQPIAYGQTVTGTISPMGDEDNYTFNGEAEQHVTAFLDNIEGWPVYLSLRLAKPDGTSWYCDFTIGDCLFDNYVLPATGVYTLTVDGEGGDTGDYTLFLGLLDVAPQPIAYGQTVTTTISPIGDEDSYTFNGEAEQHVTAFLDNIEGWPVYLSLRLAKPDGTSWYCDFTIEDCLFDNYVLPATGVYTLTVDGEGEDTGNYTLSLGLLDVAPQPITYGQTVATTISPIGDEDNYTFSGEAEQHVTAYLDNLEGWPVYLSLRLTRPDGTSWYCDFTIEDCLLDNYVLPATGVYTLTVDGEGEDTGDYTLSLYLLDVAPQPITYGQTVATTVSPIGDEDNYTFNGEAEQHVTAYLDNIEGWPVYLSLRLTRPDGTSWYCDFTIEDCLFDNYVLPATGVYTLTVDGEGEDTGDYTLTLNRPTWAELTLGESHTDTLIHNADADWYWVEVGEGEHLSVLVSKDTAWYGSLYIRHGASPTESEYDAHSYRVRGSQAVYIPVTQAGTYYIMLRSGYYSPAYGDYTITAQLGATSLLPIGEPQDIFVTSGVPWWFQIEVPTNTTNLFLTLQKYDSWSSELKLYSGGEVLASTSGSADQILQLSSPTSGTYILEVSGSGGGLLTAHTALPELPLGQWVVGTILRSWGSAWYQVSVPPGQDSLFILVETIGLWSRLYVHHGTLGDPVGWSSSGPFINAEIPSPEPGIYYVHLTDSAWIQGDDQTRDHMIKADVVPIEPPPCTDPLVTSISPTSGGTAGPVTVIVNGQCLDPEATVCLTRQGYSDVCAATVTGDDDGRTLAATFDLSATEPGDWTLVVTNPDSQSVTAPTPFTVESGGEAELWVEIIGRSAIRAGQQQTFIVRYGNSGNVDAEGIPLWIEGIPNDATWELGFEVTPPPQPLDRDPIDWESIPLHVESGDEIILPLVVPVIPPGYTGELPIRVTIPSNRQIQLRARMSPVGLICSPDSPEEQCISALLNRALGILPGVSCGIGVGCTFYNYAIAGSDPGDIHSMPLDILGTIVSCVGDLNLFTAILNAVLDTISLIDTILDCYEALLEAILPVRVITSVSPEDKFGPSGYDPPGTPAEALQRWIPADRTLDYRIDFWNKEDAPAATVDVIITDALDSNLDWTTFEFTEIGFLDWRVELEPTQYFNVDVEDVQIDLSNYYTGAPTIDLVVNVEGTFDADTAQVEWQFHALDPITREPPEEPLAGFLPPITDSGWEVGWVAFSASPKPDLASGTVISNQSYVKFDVGQFKPAPPEGPFVNTLDALPPTSAVQAPAGAQPCACFAVTWAGEDDANGSGLRGFDVYVDDLEDEAAAYLWQAGTTDTSAVFTGSPGHRYGFYARAHDNAGNVEAAPEPLNYDVEVTAGMHCVWLPLVLKGNP